MFDVSVHKTWNSSLSLWNSIVQSLSSLALLSCGIACGAPGAQLSLKLHIIIANYDMKSVTPSVFALWNHVLLRLTKSNDDSRKDPGSVNKQRRKHLHGKLCVLYISTHGPTVPDVPAHRTYLPTEPTYWSVVPSCPQTYLRIFTQTARVCGPDVHRWYILIT